ncbi:MAG: ATP-binding cassette domain-containing protein [Deltaproteobacteria bacterium]|nr:ATP-binding cassette domain-containing protein [Deltaproteobacteria bacterium]
MYLDRRLLTHTRGVRVRIAAAVVLGLCAVAAGIARLAFSGLVIAGVLTGQPFSSLIPYLGAVAGFIALRAVFQYLRDVVSQETAARVKNALHGKLYGHALDLGPGHFNQERTGDVLLSLGEGVERLQVFYGQFLPQMVVAAVAPVLIFFLMASFDVVIGVIFVVFALITLVTTPLFMVYNEETSRRRRTSYGAFSADFLDSIQGIATLKIFGRSRAQGARLAERARHLYRTTMGVLAVNMVSVGITTFGILGGTACALGWGALKVSAGELELRALIVILLMGAEIFRPMRELMILYHQGIDAMASAEGIFKLLEAPVTVREPEPVEAATEAAFTPEVRFEDVHFAYREGARPALRGVSFDLHPGEKLGVVGPSGAGKSTLVNLMLRFGDPQEGRVLLGGRDIRAIPLPVLRRHIAVVAQDMYLFYGTIADNLRMARPEATREEIEAAARAANIHDFIAGLPQGYDTVVGERGARLSGGERQRIAIARAILKDAPILVLDEALSSVDAQSEAVINEALRKLMEGRTTLIIAHRLSSVIHADRILVLERGQAAETGGHAELLAGGGTYARLMAAQAHAGGAETLEEQETTAEEPDAVAAEPAATPASGEARAAAPLSAFTVLRRLAALVRPLLRKVAVSFSAGVLFQASVVGAGAASALLVGQLIAGESIVFHLVVLGAVVTLASVLSWADCWLPHDLAYQLLAEMRIDFYDTLDPLAPAYLSRRRSGDLVSIAGGDVETVELFFAHTISPAFIAVVVPVGILTVLGLVAWPLMLALAPFLVLLALSPFMAQKRSDKLGGTVRRELGQLNAHLVDSIQGMREIVAFGHEKRQLASVLANSLKLARAQLAFHRDQAVQASLNEAVTGIGALAVLGTGVYLVGQLQMERALLPLASVLALLAFGPITDIARTFKELMETLESGRRVFAVKDEPVPVRDGTGVPVLAANGHTPPAIRFDHVNFGYDAGNGLALRDVCLDVEPGQTMALVGPSGAGKSTCAHLLLRFWDPAGGAVTLAHRDLRDFTLDHLRAQVSLVSQDTYLFNTSLRDNLRLGAPEASQEQVEEAARLAHIHNFIARLPEGYDTVVGERGVQLSGGQRQRIAIARALLKDAPVLVLDEATSHLDAINEELIQQALAELVQGRTTLVIAHRLSTIRDADRIVVLDSGAIAEQGTHDDLLRANGLYANLVMTQLVSTAEPARMEGV